MAIDPGTDQVAAPHGPRSQKTLFGHPVGLYVLFFTEAWERFSYYGMRVLLVLYMIDYLIPKFQAGGTVVGFATLQMMLESMFGKLQIQPLASQIYGLYTSLVYLTPVAGGYIADKLLGQRKTVVIGGVLMAIGHFMMACESLFLLALFFLILGNGCFKPNISTQVGGLYPPGDTRRDAAFTIFYMGINLGAFFSPFVCGTLGQKVGWHYGFGAAGVGMLIGLGVYLWGQKYLAEDAHEEAIEKHVEHKPLNGQEWKAIFGLIALCALNIVFWAVYEQQGNTMQVFADRNADWHIFGWEMPSSWFQAFNPLFIFMFAPLLTQLWSKQGRAGKEPSSVAKMAIGCFILGLAFVVMIVSTHGIGEHDRISFMWLVLTIWVVTIGELYLSPIGLSLVTKVSPGRYVSLMMGVWFLSSALGNYLSGYIGMFYSSMTSEMFFALLTVLSVISGIAMFAFQNPLKRAVGAHNV